MNDIAITQFDKSGLALLSDLKGDNYNKLFYDLEKVQILFLKTQSSLLRNEYFNKWPKDTLHWWSRIWEYPYVIYHINKIIHSRNSTNIKILDFGCGVNYFATAVSMLGQEVMCVDNDKMCIDSLLNYKKKYSGYRITPLLSEGNKIPLPEKSVDIVYSVSVFEHVTQLKTVIEEIFNIMKDDGFLIITFDVSLNDNYELKKESYNEFVKMLFEKFILVYPYKPLHPGEILNSRNSPTPYQEYSLKNNPRFVLKNYIIRPLLLKKPTRLPPRLDLAVEGMVLRKRI